MSEDKITAEKVNEFYYQGFNCSQIVFSYGAEKLGLDKETALKIAAPFGVGMFNGETCGCVIGALMVLGLKYGQCKPFDLTAKNLTIKKKRSLSKGLRKFMKLSYAGSF